AAFRFRALRLPRKGRYRRTNQSSGCGEGEPQPERHGALASMELQRRLSAARAAEIRSRISRPPAHRALLAFLALVLVLLLLVYGIAGESVGRSGTPVDHGPSPLARSSPVLTLSHGRLGSRRLPVRSAALTFDDGPDPKWTPRIARE